MIEKEDRNGNVFRVAKQMVKRIRDIDGGGCIKDCNGTIVVEREKLMEVWNEYLFEKKKRVVDCICRSVGVR
jgi:hypothetical protein